MRAPTYPFRPPVTAQDNLDAMTNLSPGMGSKNVDAEKSDTVDLSFVARSLFVETGGTVHFLGADGVEDEWTVPDNFYMHCAVVRLLADSSATGIHALK